jgi:hypothetical protein
VEAYTSQNPQSPERQPARCPDAAALATLLQACGLDAWSRQHACTDLQEGRIALIPLVCAQAQLDALFPVASPRAARAVSPSERMTPHQAIRACFFPHGAP